MRIFVYNDYPSDGVKKITEQEILDEYWDYWKGKMESKYGVSSNLITKENCVQDWVITNWAWEERIKNV